MFFILLYAVVILFVINIFYRVLIDQNKVVELKERVKDYQKEMKQHRDDSARTKEIMSKMMEVQKDMSKMTMKPLLVSFVIILIFMPFLAGFYSDHTISLADGTGILELDDSYTVQKMDDGLLISNGDTFTCETLPCNKVIEGKYWKIFSNDDKVVFMRTVVLTPIPIPFVGDELTWIWWYIMLSIPLSIIIKKLLGVRI